MSAKKPGPTRSSSTGGRGRGPFASPGSRGPVRSPRARGGERSGEARPSRGESSERPRGSRNARPSADKGRVEKEIDGGAEPRKAPEGAARPAAPTASAAPERVQKLLARHGLGSRRQVEGWIQQGRLAINGQTAQAGATAAMGDRITVDGKPLILRREASPRVLAYRKRAGEVVSRDDTEGRTTVFDRLPRVQGGRWIAIGRLDINTSGLLLFTTDGELAARLMHPSYEVEREYAVRVLGGLSDEAIQQLREGVALEDGVARALRIKSDRRDVGDAANHWYSLVVAEGRNREVRRMIEAVGGQVSRLIRVRYGPVIIPSGIPSGRGKEVDVATLEALYALVDLRMPEAARERAERTRRR